MFHRSGVAAAGAAMALALSLWAAAGARDEHMVDAGLTEFRGVREARIEVANGVPRLSINGRRVLPIIFFFNTDVAAPRKAEYLARQVALAARAGVHIYSLPFRCPRTADGVTPNYAHSNGLLDAFIEADPQALFILRLYPGPNWSWQNWDDIIARDAAVFADGSKGNVSVASDFFGEPTSKDLAGLIRHYESSRYGKRIIGYHPGGPDSEMFHDSYREKGPDYSAANERGFRRWLSAKYRAETPLREAWGDAQVTFETAGIPRFAAGRFPMHGAGRDEVIQTFYALPEERDWVDFSAYSNDVMADKVVEWARLIKRETDGRKLSVFFYGYTFELPGSFSGHYRLQRILACPEVDALVAPYSYHERLAGGAGNFMSPVDTVTAHGKLWLNEDDTRTSVLDVTQVPADFTSSSVNARARDLEETTNILERNFAALLEHRAGTWWMDLTG
ncbi:MAG: beta-galactosidase, partial [Armatimonadota bacterium]